jgi:hypothetical protein
MQWEAWAGAGAAVVVILTGIAAAVRAAAKRRIRLVPETRELLERVVAHCSAMAASNTAPPPRAEAEKLSHDLDNMVRRLSRPLSGQLASVRSPMPVIYDELAPSRHDGFMAGRTIERAERLLAELAHRERREYSTAARDRSRSAFSRSTSARSSSGSSVDCLDRKPLTRPSAQEARCANVIANHDHTEVYVAERRTFRPFRSVLTGHLDQTAPFGAPHRL